MANYCSFYMKAFGEAGALHELSDMIAWEGDFENDGLGRVYDADAQIEGSCAYIWAVARGRSRPPC